MRSLLLATGLIAPLMVLIPGAARAVPAVTGIELPRETSIIEVDRRCGPHSRYIRGHHGHEGRWVRGHCSHRR